MKHKYIIVLLIFFAASAGVFGELTARQIMEKQKELHASDTEHTEELMILRDRRGDSKQRMMSRYYKEINEDESRGLLVFNSPSNVAGTALLTWGREEGSDQWLYIPASRRLTRMESGSNKKKYFMGTDFTYEDLSPEDTDDFDYEIEREEVFNDEECWVISAVPGNETVRRESGYSKRMIWVRKDIFYTTKVEFYEAVRRGSSRAPRKIKTQLSDQLENVEGTIWRAQRTVMDNHLHKHQTFTVIQARKINERLEDEDMLFTERYLTSRRHMQ